MQDIPRNELLDKLAAGWKCRRKNWNVGNFIERNGGSSSCYWAELLKDKWEGEPPRLVRMYEGCAITFAFEKLRDGAAFVRRSSWPEGRRTCRPADWFEIHIDELLANDWEVWG